MRWIGYIWIVILVIAWLIWTIKCVVDFIRDVRLNVKLYYLLEDGPSWLIWVILHAIFIFIGSLTYFIMLGGVK
jgi:hypothetical protein